MTSKNKELIDYLIDFYPIMKSGYLTTEQKDKVSDLIVEALKVIDKEYILWKWETFKKGKNNDK